MAVIGRHRRFRGNIADLFLPKTNIEFGQMTFGKANLYPLRGSSKSILSASLGLDADPARTVHGLALSTYYVNKLYTQNYIISQFLCVENWSFSKVGFFVFLLFWFFLGFLCDLHLFGRSSSYSCMRIHFSLPCHVILRNLKIHCTDEKYI